MPVYAPEFTRLATLHETKSPSLVKLVSTEVLSAGRTVVEISD